MSNAKQETIADIVAAMMNESHAGDASCLEWVGSKIRGYAYRIEAAAKRECEATSEKSSQVGNAAKMREALYAITLIDTRMLKRLLCELVEADIFDGGQIRNTIHAVEKARQAIAAPPRNCDVGTSVEQSKRFDAHCRKHMGCFTCPFRENDGGVPKHCEFAWAQMPYEEGGVNGK